MTCPKCGYEWENRTHSPRKCPNCQVNLYRAREPWPVGYVVLRLDQLERMNQEWSKVPDPDPKPDMEWFRHQSWLEYQARQRMADQTG